MRSMYRKTKSNKKTTHRNKKTSHRVKKTKRHARRKYKGGDVQRERVYNELTPEESVIPEKSVTPFESFGFNGANSASEAAYNKSISSAKAQYEMNKLSGGGSTSAVEVPSFAPIGGIKLAYSSTDLSKDSNLTNLIGDVDATNDHWVYDVHPKTNVKGGTKKRRHVKKRIIRRK